MTRPRSPEMGNALMESARRELNSVERTDGKRTYITSLEKLVELLAKE